VLTVSAHRAAPDADRCSGPKLDAVIELKVWGILLQRIENSI
jgi:hypothetical protein